MIGQAVKRYRLILVPAQFWLGCRPALREFMAPDDGEAIYRSENPVVPLKFVMPNGDGTCWSFPRQLIELQPDSVVRVVKEWDRP